MCRQSFSDSSMTVIQGVIPEEPDAWIWLGDMAYMDNPVLDCSIKANAAHPDCICATDFLRHMPYQCLAGNIDNALKKIRSVLNSDGYGKFLEFMCPGSLRMNQFPPPGRDATICPRPILGVYDDHDFGWNNGNRRLPNKDIMKQVRHSP